MVDFTTNAANLRDAFPDPTPALRTYLQAYEALGRASNGTHQAAVEGTQAAWLAMSEEDKKAVGAVLDARPLRVQG